MFGGSEQVGRLPWYMDYYGLNQPRLTPAQRYQEKQFDPLSSLYDMSQQAYAGGFGLPQGGYPEFSGFAPGYGATPAPIRGSYKQLMGNLLGASAEERALAGMEYEPAVDEGGGVSIAGGNDLQTLLYNALRGQMGYTGARALSRSGLINKYANRWLGEGQASSFLDYISQKFGLGQWT